MTIQGAINELFSLLNGDDIPIYYKGGIQKVIETIDDYVGGNDDYVKRRAEQTEPEQMRLNDTGTQSAEHPHGLIVPLPMPIRGCCFCTFRDGNLCRFLPDDVEVVEAAKLEKRHELCPLVEV